MMIGIKFLSNEHEFFEITKNFSFDPLLDPHDDYRGSIGAPVIIVISC